MAGWVAPFAGKLNRRGSEVKVYHTIEVLAGMADVPAICKPEKMR